MGCVCASASAFSQRGHRCLAGVFSVRLCLCDEARPPHGTDPVGRVWWCGLCLQITGTALDGIMTATKAKEPQVACRRHFEARHPGVSVEAVGNHPNTYFSESRAFYKSKAAASVSTGGAGAAGPAVAGGGSSGAAPVAGGGSGEGSGAAPPAGAGGATAAPGFMVSSGDAAPDA
jgi:hypothetical protein